GGFPHRLAGLIGSWRARESGIRRKKMGIIARPNTTRSHSVGWSKDSENKRRSFLAFLRDAPWLRPGRIFGYSTALIAGTVAVMVWALSGRGTADPMGRPVGTDFLRLWTASYAVLHSETRAIYNPAAFFALEQAVTQPSTPDFYPWNYPPPSLLTMY